MRAILVDDELLLVNELNKLLQEFPEIEIVGSYTDPSQAYLEIEKTRPEVAFLDIEMAGINGLELADKLVEKIPDLEILFVTAYNHYATEAFDTNALDYILKPVRSDRLNKALLKLNSRKIQVSEVKNQSLRIQSFGKFGVFVDEIPIKWTRAKQQELFAYLLQNEGRWVDKYKICDDLWNNLPSNQALANLQTAIWSIRKVIKESGLSDIKIDFHCDSYILYLQQVNWDLKKINLAFQNFMEDNTNTNTLIDIRDLYQKGYLYYEDWNWSIIERSKYEKKYRDILKLQQTIIHENRN